jgi:hypothetical protein
MKGKKVTVSLAGRDVIVNTEAVKRYPTGNNPLNPNYVRLSQRDVYGNSRVMEIAATSKRISSSGMKIMISEDVEAYAVEEKWKSRSSKGEGIKVLWFKDADHGQMFETPASRKTLIEVIQRYCKVD